jgi:hypothetical protein
MSSLHLSTPYNSRLLLIIHSLQINDYSSCPPIEPPIIYNDMLRLYKAFSKSTEMSSTADAPTAIDQNNKLTHRFIIEIPFNKSHTEKHTDISSFQLLSLML